MATEAHLQLLIDGSKATAAVRTMEQALMRLADRADKAQTRLDKIGAKAIRVRVSAEGIDKATASAKALQAQLSAIKPISIKATGADFSRLSSDLTSLQRQINRINRSKVGPQGSRSAGAAGASAADLDKITEKAKATQTALNRISRRAYTVQVNGSQIERALKTVQTLQEQINRIKNIDLKTTGDLSGVRRDLSAIQAQIAKINASTVQPKSGHVSPLAGAGAGAAAGAAGAALPAAAGAAGAGLISAGTAGLAAAGATAVIVGKQVVEVRARFQDLETRLQTMTGSAEAAAEAQEYLANTAKRLSVDMFDLADSYTKFLPMIKDGTLSIEQARAMLEGLVNTQKATGASAEDLKNSMFGLAQTLGMPVANMEQLNQVTEPLPGLLGLMDKAIAKLYPSAKQGAGAMRAMVEAGQVSNKVFRDVMIEALQEYAGAAEKSAGNINATMVRLKNSWNSLLNTLGDKIDTPLVAFLDIITKAIEGLERGIGGLVRGIEGVGVGVQRLHTMYKSLDWSSPLESMAKGWETAKEQHPAPAAVPEPGTNTGTAGKPAPGTVPTLPTGGKPAPLISSGKKDPYTEEKGELKAQIALLDQMVAAYDHGREGVQEFRNAEKLLGDQLRYSGQFTKKQAAELMELSKAALALEDALALKEALGSMQEAIAATQGLADAQAMGAEAVRHVEAANTAYNAALQVGMVGNEAARAQFLELAKAAQAAEAALALNQRLASMDIDLTAMDDLIRAHEQGTRAVEDAIVASEAYKLAIQDGVSANKDDVDAIRSRIAALRDLQSVADQQADVRGMKTDLSGITAQSDALRLNGEAYVRRSAEIEKSIELERAGMDATSALGQSQIALAGDLAVATNQLSRQNDALRDLANSGMTFNESMRAISYGGLTSMEDALVDIVTGTKSVKEAFADMARSIAADLARMAIRQAITVPLAMGLNSLFMGGAGMAAAPAFGGFASAASVGPINWMHKGGIAGRETTKAAIGDLSAFSNAPRYHTGKPGTARAPALKAGEMPTILKRDEGVFTPAQMASLAPVGSANPSSSAPSVSMTNNITVNQPQGATEAEGQRFGKGIARELEAMVDSRISHAFRPGGIRNPAGY